MQWAHEDVTINITWVNQATQETGAAAYTVLGVSSELTDQPKNLRQQVDKFLDQTRSELIKRFYPEYVDALRAMLEFVKQLAVQLITNQSPKTNHQRITYKLSQPPSPLRQES